MQVLVSKCPRVIFLPIVMITFAIFGCGRTSEKEADQKDEPEKISLVEFPTQPFSYQSRLRHN